MNYRERPSLERTRSNSTLPGKRKRAWRTTFLSTILLLNVSVSGAFAGQTYYVDFATGSDASTNPGTDPAFPLKGVLAAGSRLNTQVFQKGDQILFKRGGNWTGFLTPKGSGTADEPIVWGAYGPVTSPNPFINRGGGFGSQAILLNNLSHVTIRDLKISNQVDTGTATKEGWRDGIRIRFNGNGSYGGIKIIDNEICDVYGYTSRASAVNWSTGAVYVEVAGRVANPNTTPPTTAIIPLVDGILIQGNDFHDNRCIAIQTKPDGGNYSGHPERWMKNFVVRDNVIRNNGLDHILIQGADAPLIEYNAGYDAGALVADGVEMVIAGMWVCYYTRNSLFQYNEVARTRNKYANGANGDSQAFDVDYGTYDNHIFQYNYTHDNEGGILIMMPADTSGQNFAKTTIFRYNISVNDGRNTNRGGQFGLSPVVGKSTAHVYNNVIYTTRPEGIRVSNSAATSYSNNIFYATSGFYPSMPKFSNNCFFGHKPEVNDPLKIVADPKFVGPLPAPFQIGVYQPYAYDTGDIISVNNIFKLAPGSPCIDAGRNIADNGGKDFFQQTFSPTNQTDIGAHELLGASGTPQGTVTYIDNAPSGNVLYGGAGVWEFIDTAVTPPNYAYNSTIAKTTKMGNWVEFTFTGTNATLFAKRSRNMGRFTVSIDGGPESALQTAHWPQDIYQAEVYQVTGLSPTGQHKMKVTLATNNIAAYNEFWPDYILVRPGNPPAKPAVVGVDDPSGNYSAISAGSGQPGWTAVTQDFFTYAGTYHSSDTAGDAVDFTFTGTGVQLFGPRAGSYGKMNVTLNGVTQLVSCYAPFPAGQTTSENMTKLYEVNGLPLSTYTLRIVNAGLKDPRSTGNRVVVDYLRVLTGGVEPQVNVDAKLGIPAVKYSGAWQHQTDAAYFGGTKSVTNAGGLTVTYTFMGSGVSLYAKKDSGLGKLNVQVDDGPVTVVDCYAPAPIFQAKVFEQTALNSNGYHILKVTTTSSTPAKNVGIDYFSHQP